MDNVWQQSGSSFFLRSKANQIAGLEVGIYRLCFDVVSGSFYLDRLYDKFDFNHKLYQHDMKFIDRVVKTYSCTKGNLGILLNGIKGTGKSVSAKLICNKLNVPVIIVNQNFANLAEFLNAIPQDVAIFIDEFEKVFEEEDNSLLAIMDGALSNPYRKSFILTTNDIYININLKQRPSRIRYIKSFNDMSAGLVEEIVDDLLENKELKQNCISFISKLEIITIDLVKSIIQEVNIHNETPDNFKEFFNCSNELPDRYNVTKLDKKGIKLLWSDVELSSDRYVGATFTIDHTSLGTIIGVDEGNNQVIIEVEEDNYFFVKEKKLTLRLDLIQKTHRSYLA